MNNTRVLRHEPGQMGEEHGCRVMKNYHRIRLLKYGIFLTALSFFFFSIGAPVSALLNPSAVYCTALGYNFTTTTDQYGEKGLCQLPNNQNVDSWKFLLGESDQEYSFCTKQGYPVKVVNDREKCSVFGSGRCAVCVLSSGEEVEVTKLMNLTFDETQCGDGVCGFPEDYKTCPQDCPSGRSDAYCDGQLDGVCDPDCANLQDLDCDMLNPMFLGLLIFICIIVLIMIVYMKKKKSRRSTG